jgi:hypothetical protein
MKLIILRNDCNGQVLPISEGIAETRQFKPCKGNNLTTWHTRPGRTPRVATVHNVVKETIRTHLTLVHVFHTYASADIPWVSHALSHYTPVRYGRISSISAAHDATQFRDSIYLICISTFQMLVHSDPTDAGLKQHKRGLPPWSSEFQIRPLSFLPIQYSLFFPNYPTRSPIMLTI